MAATVVILNTYTLSSFLLNVTAKAFSMCTRDFYIDLVSGSPIS